MTKLKTKNFIRGVGSVLDIYPSKGKYSIKRTQQTLIRRFLNGKTCHGQYCDMVK
jgi:hypothetical protein